MFILVGTGINEKDIYELKAVPCVDVSSTKFYPKLSSFFSK